MSRVEQGEGARGSLKWIQKVVNQNPALMDDVIRRAFGWDDEEQVQWLSPLKSDAYAEYRDEAFLDLLGVRPYRVPLVNFWPPRGPQWDALARTSGGRRILVEAKANLPELVTPASGASEKSRARIVQSLDACKRYLGVDAAVDWSGQYYQYCNRLAHLYWLRVLNELPAYLVLVYFVKARDVNGPATVAQWDLAIDEMYKVIGLGKDHALSPFVVNVYIDLAQAANDR